MIGVNSGTDALVLLLRACGLRPGDEVIVPAYQLHRHGQRRRAGGRAAGLRRHRPGQLRYRPGRGRGGGDRADRDDHAGPPVLHSWPTCAAFSTWPPGTGLTVVEDSAEAIGMRWDGVHAGLLGGGGVLSFFPTKTLGAIGDAGAVITDERRHRPGGRRRCATTAGRAARWAISRAISNPTVFPGMNSKMDEIQAAVLLAKLDRLDADITRRSEIADFYTDRLGGIGGILRTPALAARPVPVDPVWYVYLIETDRRDRPRGISRRARNRHRNVLSAGTPLAAVFRPSRLPARGFPASPRPPASGRWRCRSTRTCPWRTRTAVCDEIARFYRGGRG